MVARNAGGGGRVQFPGDPIPGESGSGQAPQIPLNTSVAPTSVEMLDGSKSDDDDEDQEINFRKPAKGKVVDDDDEDDDEEDDEEPAGPEYSRERIGALIGEGGPVATAHIVEVEESLDTEDVVPCLFQKQVNLQDRGLMHHFGAGVQMVPVSLAGETKKGMHWYLKAHGVKRMQKAPIPNPKLETEEA